MRTDSTIKYGPDAGSWAKGCDKKGNYLEMFGGEESDRCIELTDENTKHIGIKVCNINS